MSLTYWAMPALVSLFVKCSFVVYLLQKRTRRFDKALLALVCAFFLLNIVEFLSFTEFGKNLTLLKLYYLLTIICLILVTHLVTIITQVKTQLITLLHGCGLAVIVLLLSTDLIVLDMARLHHTITRVAGEFYILFQLFAVMELVISLSLIFRSTFSTNLNNVMRARSSLILISLLPLIFSSLSIVMLMAYGLKINAVVITPLMTTLFLLGCIYARSNKKIFDFSLLIPGTVSWNKKEDFLFFLYADNENIDLQGKLLQLERMYIEDAICRNQGKVSKAAVSLGYSPGKLDYRLKSIHQLNQK